MKPMNLNPTQKKWALTSALLAVLGLNLSTPLFSPETSGTTEMSSFGSYIVDVKEHNMAWEDGKTYRVKFVPEGDRDQRTAVIIMGMNTEGRPCGDCTTSQVLDVPYEKSLSELEAALRLSMKRQAEARTDKSEEEAAPAPAATAESAEDRKLEQDRRQLSALLGRCKRSNNLDQARCLSDNLVSLLRSKKGDKKINADEALAFFNDEIKPLVIDLGYSLDGLQDGSSSAFDYQRAADLMKRLHAKLPAEYREIRTAATDASLEIIKKYNDDVRQKKAQAALLRSQAETYRQQAETLKASNPAQSNQMLMAAMQLQNQAMQIDLLAGQQSFVLQNGVLPYYRDQQYSGLTEALGSKLIDQSIFNQLMTRYDNQAQNVILGINADGTITVAPSVGGSVGTGVVTVPAGVRSDNLRGGTGTAVFGPARQFNPNLIVK